MSQFKVGPARTSEELSNDFAQLLIMLKAVRREMEEYIQKTNYALRKLEQDIAILDSEIQRLKQ